jgi:enterobactin synthetase component D
LGAAAEVRVREHLAGRLCAEAALRDAGAPHGAVGVDADRAPIWPPGFVGSITHTRAYACAAVAHTSELAGLGIDSEPLLSADVLRDVAPLSFVASEETWLQGADRLVRATIVFSAKESLYKCLRPRVGVFFDLPDACVEAIDPDGRFRIRLLRHLPGYPRGFCLDGRYAIARGLVHTAIALPAAAFTR